MIDFHSHILPGMDDGSCSAEQSRLMLQMMAAQGVDTVVATPHYYRLDNTAKEFCARRREALDALRDVLAEEGMPALRLGAEVAYFSGISDCEGLRLLRIEGTRTLLLEMPFRPWNDAIVGDVLALTEHYTVVLAHIERYWFMQPGKIRRAILHSACRLQVNAMGLCIWPISAMERRCLKKGIVQVIGSDCHGHKFRPPCVGRAWKRLDEETRRTVDMEMRKLLEE